MEPPPHVDVALDRRLSDVRHSFVISDPRQPDCPVVFASQEFLHMTGYKAKEVIGRNCRFLQGPKTSRRSVSALRTALHEQRPCQLRLLNYRKDGTTFWNLLYIAPVFGGDGKLATYFVGIQTPVDPPGSDEEEEEGEAVSEVDTIEKITEALRQFGKGSEEVARETGSLSSPLLLALMAVQQSFVLVDARKEDMPIVHASQRFCQMCGYSEHEVLGRNCRFLQGDQTRREDVARLSEAIRRNKAITVRLLNYKKDGTPFWNSLHIAPIRNADGEVEFFIGVQIDVTAMGVESPGSSKDVTMEERLMHSGAVGAVRVAVRAQSGHDGQGLSRCI